LDVLFFEERVGGFPERVNVGIMCDEEQNMREVGLRMMVVVFEGNGVERACV
jgi:hypothetical protein